MTSLTEVYEGGAGGADLRRLYVGVGLFVAGAVLTVAGVVVGTSTTAATALGLGVPYGAREIAGILAGVGLPATFLGAITVLPKATWRLRAAAVLGATVAVVGVVLFTAVYPSNWYGMPTDYTLPVTFVYFLGALTTLWCLFVAIANFKARNDPGGTVRLEVTREGETRVVEVSNERLRQGLGGIGLLGATPDGDAETQTNRPDRTRGAAARSDGGSTATANADPRRNQPGSATASGVSEVGASDGAEVMESNATETPPTDSYCGNCAHFNYVRTDDGLQPYCGHHAEVMDDMDPCRQWEGN